MKTSDKTDLLWPAIVKAKRAIKNPKREAENPAFKRDGKAMRYADLSACIEVVDDACDPYGLATMQELTGDSSGISVSTIVVHESGQWVQFDPLFVPAARLDPQGFGSAATYTRRYALKATWNLSDVDDDGHAAVNNKPVSVPEPIGFRAWLDNLQAMSETADLDTFRDNYKSALAKHRKYLEETQPATLNTLVERARQNAPLPVL